MLSLCIERCSISIKGPTKPFMQTEWTNHRRQIGFVNVSTSCDAKTNRSMSSFKELQ